MSEDSEPEEGVDARGALVFKENRTNAFYKVGTIACSAVGETSAIICIAELGGRLIVAVPGAVWAKKVAKRKLEKSTLGKALGVDVVACSEADLENPLPEVSIKAWVGVLSMNDEAKVEFVTTPPTYDFGTGVLPYAEALVRVADEHFAFTTAESGGGGDGIFKRMSLVESGLADMREMLKTLVGQTGEATPSTATGARPKAGLHTGKARASGGATQTAGDLEALDRSTVAAARAAGISDESLKEMSRLIGAKRNKVEEIPIPEALDEDDGAGIDGELDEEAANLEDLAAQNGKDLMETAVVHLTKLVSNMAQENKKKGQDLESLLDQTPGSSSTSDSTFGGNRRSHAAALRALTKAFNESPRLIYESIEGQMERDFTHTPAALSTGVCSARAWLCSRSRIGNFQNHVRWSWQVAGILDDLATGAPERARARACLLLAAADQASIDGGSWVMSTVAMLEPIPPYQEFSKHSAPSEPGDGSVRPQVGRDLLGDSQGAREVQRGKEKASSSRPEPRFWPTPESGRSTWRQASQRKGQRRQERRRWFGAKVRQVALESAEEDGARDEGMTLPPSSLTSPFSPQGPIASHSGRTCKVGSGAPSVSGRPGRELHDPPRHVPGSCVGPVDPLKVFASYFQQVFRCPNLGQFLKSCFRRAEPDNPSGEHRRASGEGTWPMPLPYPEVFKMSPQNRAPDQLKKLVVSVQICILNYLDLGRPTRAPPQCRAGAQLTAQQWEVVKRFECFLGAWFKLGTLSASDMGRTAGKIEDLERVLDQLKALTSVSSSSQQRGDSELGRLRGTKMGTFKVVEADRLQFRGFPDFDPKPFLDDFSRDIYEHPFEHAIDPEDFMGKIPRVRVHCTREERIKLYQLLDKSRRVRLFTAEEVREQFGSGVFAVLKSLEFDRLILDSRPHNLLENPPGRFIQTLGSGEALTHLHLEGGERLYISSNDIRDFYHLFHVSEDRCR